MLSLYGFYGLGYICVIMVIIMGSKVVRWSEFGKIVLVWIVFCNLGI